jgi:uncharacterized membrane protein
MAPNSAGADVEDMQSPELMPPADLPLTGTINQIEWAGRIRANVIAEFERVAKALSEAAAHRAGDTGTNARLALVILADKRDEVMANDRAGYFIHEWQESDAKVRQMITRDPRYEALRVSRLAG